MVNPLTFWIAANSYDHHHNYQFSGYIYIYLYWDFIPLTVGIFQVENGSPRSRWPVCHWQHLETWIDYHPAIKHGNWKSAIIVDVPLKPPWTHPIYSMEKSMVSGQIFPKKTNPLIRWLVKKNIVKLSGWWVVWNMAFIFHHIWDVILPIDPYFSRWLLHHQRSPTSFLFLGWCSHLLYD